WGRNLVPAPATGMIAFIVLYLIFNLFKPGVNIGKKDVPVTHWINIHLHMIFNFLKDKYLISFVRLRKFISCKETPRYLIL
ncbi:MAG TPA: hypothetical protein VG847_08675, partial [Chitinophagaceae bacterium]|nr:hypothetical protein [Chitinophagaceae bacterium]